MTQIATALFAHLSADAGVSALVGDRIYPQRKPQDAPLPAVVWHTIDTPRVNTHGDAPGDDTLAHPRIQFDALSEDRDGVSGYDEACAITTALRLALHGFRGDMAGLAVGGVLAWNTFDGYDETPDRFCRHLDTTWWVEEVAA